MPRRKKFPKLPNGYGQIRYLGKGRRNPYGVYPPATEEYDNGKKKTPPAICYVSDRMVGLAVLTSYHAGTYTPGDEIIIEKEMRGEAASGQNILDSLVADYNKAMFSITSDNSPTFSDVFMRYYRERFGREYGHKEKKPSAERNMIAAYKNSEALHNYKFNQIVADDLQKVVDTACEKLSRSGLTTITTLFNQLYKYAEANDLCEKNYAKFVKIKKDDDTEHGVPFSESDLRILWKNKENEVVEFLLIMCYSGFRITEYKTLEVNLDQKYFKGGIKTEAGKGRIVPIHPGIITLVSARMERLGCLLPITASYYRQKMYPTLQCLGIERHTPHDCRHTFSALCERYGVNENDRKRMLGHSFGADITNSVYGHRSIEDLRKEIEKIKIDLL